ncbi:CRTAC1 family protein [Oscillatoria sp. CS-180]|uniref:CRTAC1 family protein n=1 Tax=Oscillatoria sp. CS-180 TaxID=3021720 RepID=UPI00232C4A0B|nr:CRTAC1 family protein [Oscillatoria sp. CS-180]
MVIDGRASESRFWFNLFDLGVADVNDDDLLDIFTAHHSESQALLINDGAGGFTNTLSDLRLAQNPNFPGFEVMDRNMAAAGDLSGLHISRTNDAFPELNEGGIKLAVHRLEEGEEISGVIEFPYQITIGRQERFDLETTEDALPSGAIHSSLAFSANEGGILEVYPSEPFLINTPVSFELSSQLSLDNVHVGGNYVQPEAHNFDLILRDRHGMVWADYDGDAQVDLFVTRGGLKGRLPEIPGVVNDELFLNRGSDFDNRAAQLGISKGGCPGRQAASVDYNNDGLLDIYIACGRGGRGLPISDPGVIYPNQLYQQQPSGEFANVAQAAGLDIPENGPFIWLDADNDGDMDLFWQDETKFQLYVNQAGTFESRPVELNSANKIGKLAVSDYDSDGDIDIFAASSAGNVLLVNDGGSYKSVAPAQSGLPAESLTANWVDYDNDGLTDLYAAPYGLYHQGANHRFEKTDLLKDTPDRLLAEVRPTWFDVNNDGALDLVSATRYHVHRLAKVLRLPGSSSRRNWTVAVYQGSRVLNHWLEIKLVGEQGNHQAIGARVVVETPDGLKQTKQVGHAEGSLYSQGHYRLYFGLGKNKQIDSLKVFWPDGSVQEITAPEEDQLLVISQNEGLA